MSQTLPLLPGKLQSWGTRALEREAQQLGEATSRYSAQGDTRTRAGGPSFCVGLGFTSHISGWLWPWGCGFGILIPAFLMCQHLREEAVGLKYGVRAPRLMPRLYGHGV